MMRSVESAGSVFYYSQEEDSLKMGGDTLGSHRDVLAGPPYDHDGMADSSPVSRDAEAPGRLVFIRPVLRVTITRPSRMNCRFGL